MSNACEMAFRKAFHEHSNCDYTFASKGDRCCKIDLQDMFVLGMTYQEWLPIWDDAYAQGRLEALREAYNEVIMSSSLRETELEVRALLAAAELEKTP